MVKPVMLEQQHHALVKVLLPQREAKLLLRASQDHRALLNERALVDEALVAAKGRRVGALGLHHRALLRHEACAHLPPVSGGALAGLALLTLREPRPSTEERAAGECGRPTHRVGGTLLQRRRPCGGKCEQGQHM